MVALERKINKTDRFKNKATLIHNNLYSYSNVDYKKAHSKVMITCNLHGIFLQTPNEHLKGKGCRKCFNKRWGLINKNKGISNLPNFWFKTAEKTRNFESFKVYIIKFYNDDEVFYKVGKTFKNINCRIDSILNQSNYNYELIKIIEDKRGNNIKASERISRLEKYIHNKLIKYKYIPKVKFDGNTECFSIIKLN
jgi:hypothetical protein